MQMNPGTSPTTTAAVKYAHNQIKAEKLQNFETPAINGRENRGSQIASEQITFFKKAKQKTAGMIFHTKPDEPWVTSLVQIIPRPSLVVSEKCAAGPLSRDGEIVERRSLRMWVSSRYEGRHKPKHDFEKIAGAIKVLRY